MERYVGVDPHSKSCTLGVMSASGQRLKSLVVETNGSALVEAVRGIPGRLHVCLEEGTQSAWLYELLKPHVAEVVVAVAPEQKGPKDDQRDAWARANELRTGSIETRVYKAPEHLASLRNAVRAYGFAVTDVVRAKNRLKAVFLSRGLSVDASVYDAAKRPSMAEEAALSVPGAGGVVGAATRPVGAAARRSGTMAAQGVEDAPDHPEAVHGARHGSDPHGAGRGDCGDAGSFSDATPVVELQRAGDRDAVFGGLGSGQEWEVGACAGRPDTWAESQAASSAEGGVQGSGDDGDRAASRRPTARRLRADAAIWDQADAWPS